MTTIRSTQPLSNTTVLSLEQAIAAPLCTRHLADLGARVIKLERPETGDFARHYDTRANGLCSHFVWVNRSKESLALDLKNSKDIETVKKLLSKVDVLVQNLAPGATDRLGLSYEKLKDEFPGLIVCDISGYGQDGPYRDKKAYDLLIQSEAGVLSVTGSKSEPAKVGISIADISAGMYAYSNILAALMQRDKNGGKGCRIDISMLECMAEWMGFPMYYSYPGVQPGPERAGASHSSIYPYGPFEVCNGEGKGSVMLGIQNQREWVNFCKIVLQDESVTNDERFDTNVKRSQNREELKKIIENKFEVSSVEDITGLLDRAGIANAKVNDMKGLWEHPQLSARGRWTQFETENGPVKALIPPGVPGTRSTDKEEGVEVRMGKLPTVGEHNERILKELGLIDTQTSATTKQRRSPAS